jgi:hypothetical protein
MHGHLYRAGIQHASTTQTQLVQATHHIESELDTAFACRDLINVGNANVLSLHTQHTQHTTVLIGL